MLISDPTTTRAEFEEGTGWLLKPEGACRGDVCIPLTDPPTGEQVDPIALAAQIGLPIVTDDTHGVTAIGPSSAGARTLASAEAPELRLPDLEGNEFALSSLRGQKVMLVAWSPY